MSRDLQIRLLQILLPTLGMTTLLTPLALWIAWSPALYYGVLIFAACSVSGFLAVTWMLHRIGAEDAAAPARPETAD